MCNTLLFISLLLLSIVLAIHCRSAFPDKTDQAFLDDCLKSTNKARTAHKTSLIKYDNELQKYAKERAKYMSTGIGLALKHKNLKEDVGENIYRAVGGDKVKVCMNAIKNWYSEISYYSFPAGLFVPKAGHFTQLMWDATKKMGCARVMNPVDSAGKRNEIYIVCVYKEAGNVKGEYKVNVKSPTKKIANFAANLDLDVTTLSPADALFNEPDVVLRQSAPETDTTVTPSPVNVTLSPADALFKEPDVVLRQSAPETDTTVTPSPVNVTLSPADDLFKE